TFESAPNAWTAAPVPRSPQPIKPTRSTSLPAACAFEYAAIVPVAAAVFKKTRREADPGVMTVPLSLFQWVQFKLPNKQLESLGLEQDLAGRREDVIAFVDGCAVHANRDAVARA